MAAVGEALAAVLFTLVGAWILFVALLVREIYGGRRRRRRNSP